MKMIDELKPMRLYSSNQKVYAPIDEKDKRHGAAILLLSPNINESIKMMRLPYIHNPNLFISYYIDRNVMDYISPEDDIDELDEVKEFEESAYINSAAIDNKLNNVKFILPEDITYADRNYFYDVFKGKTLDMLTSLSLKKVPKSIKVIVHYSVEDLRKSAPENIKNIYGSKLYGYSYANELHILSKMIYDQETMWGDYKLYLITELYNLIIFNSYNTNYKISKGVSIFLSGMYSWIKSHNTKNCSFIKDELFISNVVQALASNFDFKYIRDLILNGCDDELIKQTLSAKTLGNLRRIVFESGLTTEERNKLPDDEFGIPSKRAYPLNDEDHVIQAIRMFNHCDSKDEKELAQAIIKKIEKFNIKDVSISNKNRFSKYYSPTTESAVNIVKEKPDGYIGNYDDVERICSDLDEDELRRITFSDKYEDSEFIIKRIIDYVDEEPAGFLDVHYFPTRPELAQIVIAVSRKYRGMGIAKNLVSELLDSDLESEYHFKMYYWTAHQDNFASQNLAMSSGFKDINKLDSYGRKIFIKRVSEPENYEKEVKIHSENSIINENGSIFLLESEQGSQKIKRYLYRERLRTNKDMIEKYKQMKVLNPAIKKTYLSLEMYKQFNIFVDLYYYHELFLKNNTFKLDKAIKLYLEFLNNLIKTDLPGYHKKTIFIPVDKDSWNIAPGSDVGDYKVNLNPISLISRLVRIDPDTLRSVFGNKTILFVGKRGYFKVDFSNFELKDLNRFNINIKKLMSDTEPVVDDFEKDEKENVDSKKAIAAQAIDKIEQEKNISINNISKIDTIEKDDNDSASTSEDKEEEIILPNHLKITSTPISIKKHKYADKDVAIINIDSSDLGDISVLKKSPVYKSKLIDIYCAPNKE